MSLCLKGKFNKKKSIGHLIIWIPYTFVQASEAKRMQAGQNSWVIISFLANSTSQTVMIRNLVYNYRTHRFGWLFLKLRNLRRIHVCETDFVQQDVVHGRVDHDWKEDELEQQVFWSVCDSWTGELTHLWLILWRLSIKEAILMHWLQTLFFLP